MPHIVIEHSDNIAAACDVQALVETVHAAALTHPLTPDDGLRTRAAGRRHYRIADGDPRYAFVAVVARIGPGRDERSKQSFATLLIDTVDRFLLAEAADLVVALSCEVQEIDHPHRINRNHIRNFRRAEKGDS